MKKGNKSAEFEVQMTHGFVLVDTMFFDMATKLIEYHETSLQQFKAEMRRYWAAAHAAASIAMVCAAMEAHANYLLREAADGTLPNYAGISKSACEAIVNRLSNLEAKWLLTSMVLTGKQVLDSGQPPFEGFRRAVSRRNNYIAHPKMEAKPLRPGGKLREYEELTIQNARDAVATAQETVRLVYAAMATEPPRWSQ